jgi:hypothetical protein
VRRITAVGRGDHQAPCLHHLAVRLDPDVEVDLHRQRAAGLREHHPDRADERLRIPRTDLQSVGVVGVELHPVGEIGRVHPALVDHLGVAKAVRRLPLAVRGGDRDAKRGRRGEQALRQSVERCETACFRGPHCTILRSMRVRVNRAGS